MEAEQYQTTSQQLESEGSNMRLEIMTKDSELRRAHDKLDNMEREIQEVSNGITAVVMACIGEKTRSLGHRIIQ